MEKKSSSASGGIGFVGLLTITFIVLKLVGVINWSWWVVLWPLWFGVAIIIIILFICYIIKVFRKL